MKRLCVLILAVLFLLSATMLSGYAQKNMNDKISVVCTIFPQYDWVREVLGDQSDHVALNLLLDRKIDLHSYQPSVEEIAMVSSCDLFICIGGESDEWVGDVLQEAVNKDMVVIYLLDTLGNAAKTEELVEGMEAEDHDQDEEPEGEDDHDHDTEYDEHVWLSLKNAQLFCAVIADALSALDADNADVYQRNVTAYNQKLSALDGDYQEAVNTAPAKVLLFGDRFPFRYLVDDYGLDYYAAFAGCSAEIEASFYTIVFLAGKIDELDLKNVIVTESSDQSIAKTIRNNSRNKDQQILVLNSMQSVTSDEIRDGVSYLSIAEGNLSVLKDALR